MADLKRFMTPLGLGTWLRWLIPACAVACLIYALQAFGTAATAWGQEPDLPAAAESGTDLSADGGPMGDAVDEPAPRRSMLDSIWRLFADGGLLMVPIVVCSVVLMVFVLERTYTLRRRRVIPKPFVTRFLHQLHEDQLDANDALTLCEEDGSVVAQVFAAAVKKWNRPSVEVEQAILDAGEREAYSLRKYLRLFNGIATITPLLGLLGTVVGMIQCFEAISASQAMGRPELLAAGIGKALLTTAGGLFVAIPALMAYMYFTSRVDQLVVEIDRLGQELVAAVASDGWKDKSRSDSKRKAAKAA